LGHTLAVWMDIQINSKEHPNGRMKKATDTVDRLQIITKTYDVVAESVWALQVA
jgi:hypothetical protein